MELWDLRQAYYEARRAKRRKDDSVEFELNLNANLIKLLDAVNRRRYLSDNNYAFVVRRPRPREVFAAEFSSRILHHYVAIRIAPLLEAEYTSRAFNNRVGYGTDAAVWSVYNDIYDLSEGYTRNDCWIIKWDLQGYFPNANLDIAYNLLQDLVIRKYTGPDLDELLYLIRVCIYAYPQNHCYRKSALYEWAPIAEEKSIFYKPDGVGAAIGFLIWQMVMNYYINHVDHWAVDYLGLRYTRYVDDTVVITNDKAMVLNLLPEFRNKYREVGVNMHPHKFYCQHYTKGVEFIGTHIKMQRIYLNSKIIGRAFDAAQHCYDYESYMASMNSYLGMLKMHSEKKKAIELLDMIPDVFIKDYQNFKIKINHELVGN